MILKTFQALFEHTDVRPGCVVCLQAFGAYGANFNPHAHALVSDGVFSAEGEFLPLPSPDIAALMEVFRRLLLQRLYQAERLSENFMHNLLSWALPPQAGCSTGFSVFAGPPVEHPVCGIEAATLTSLESQARYISRPALAMDALQKLFEVDPLVCACGARMQIISFITDSRVVDRILRHRESERCRAKYPFEPRAPPSAYTRSRQ